MGRTVFFGGIGRIEELFTEFNETVEQCLIRSYDALRRYMCEDDTSEVSDGWDACHELESEADRIRREIINELLSGSLLPNARADVMNLVEEIDTIADTAQGLIDDIMLTHLDVQKLDVDLINAMMDKITEEYGVLKEAVHRLFSDADRLVELTKEIEELDKEVDGIASRIIRGIAGEESFSVSDKVFYRDFIKKIRHPSKLIENASDRLEIVVAVRKG